MARQAIAQLAENPRPGRAKELEDHTGYYRLWLPRTYRLVWSVIEDDRVVYLLYGLTDEEIAIVENAR